MIYCVIPEALADELYERLSEYYRDEPNVEVIIDRRHTGRRKRGSESAGGKRELRDRRRRRPPGSFPEINVA